MVKRTKLLAILMAGLIATTSLVGCGSKTNEGGETPSGEKQKLTVWSHFKTAEVDAFAEVAKAWGAENNVDVEVVEDQGEFQEMIQAAQSNNGPDIILGVPHDNLGTFQKAGITAEVPAGLVSADKYTSELIVDSVTIGGKQYAIPFAQETTALFVNKDLVSEVPKTMEELVEKAKEVGFAYNIKDFYFSYAFLAANGGYIFKNNNGTLDSADIGLGNEGAIKGLTFLNDLVKTHKLMSSDITGDIANGEFMAKKTGFYISGPWDVGAAQEAGINLEVVPLPTLDGKAPQPFLGVQAGFVNENSQNKELAWKLMEEFIANGQDIVYKDGNRIPVAKDYNIESEFTKAFVEQAKTAYPMPNIPEVQDMWDPAKDNITLLLTGEIDPQTSGANIVQQMKDRIEANK